MTTLIPPDYAAWLAELKTTIRTARLKAGLAVNRELVRLYWRIGKVSTVNNRDGICRVFDHAG